MLHYLLQIVIFQLVFLIIYDFFHKNETFFNWNRLYLIITPILSLILPFIKINSFKPSNTSKILVTRLDTVIKKSSQSLESIGTSGSELDNTNWWLILYFTGLGISLFLFILKLYKLNILKTLSIRSKLDDKKIIVLPNSNQAFSFWNTIYIGDRLGKEERKQILVHEIVHVEQKHTVDQLIFELLKVILWWNPLVYNYQSRITILHEYIADAEVITTENKTNYIEQLLNAAFQTQEIKFVNQFFSQSLIKKRIIMLQKNRSKSISKFKYLLLIPVVTSILTYTSCSDNIDNNDIVSSSVSENSLESTCLNQNAIYDKKIDNFLRLETAKDSEIIANLVNIETEKSVRKAHIKPMAKYTMKNIPEGKYKLHITYGKGYKEETINGNCMGYFSEEIETEIGEDIIDFNIATTANGKDVPSYELLIDQHSPEYVDQKNQEDDLENIITVDESTFACLNTEAYYDENLDNYLELITASETEAIFNLVLIETGKSIRTVHLMEENKTLMKNIPEGKYQLHIDYGTGYIEKNINGKCIAFFKNLINTEKGHGLLDFTVTKDEKGLDVPSYSLMIDNEF